MDNLILIYTTFSSTEEARFIAEKLLSKKLVACVNIFPEVSSLYLWKGKINNSCEVVAIMKSKSDQAEEIIKEIEAIHSYAQPVIAVLPIENANKSFTNWANNVINVHDN